MFEPLPGGTNGQAWSMEGVPVGPGPFAHISADPKPPGAGGPGPGGTGEDDSTDADSQDPPGRP